MWEEGIERTEHRKVSGQVRSVGEAGGRVRNGGGQKAPGKLVAQYTARVGTFMSAAWMEGAALWQNRPGAHSFKGTRGPEVSLQRTVGGVDGEPSEGEAGLSRNMGMNLKGRRKV